MNNITWIAGKRPNYMNKMTRKETSTIFKARTRMLDVNTTTYEPIIANVTKH